MNQVDPNFHSKLKLEPKFKLGGDMCGFLKCIDSTCCSPIQLIVSVGITIILCKINVVVYVCNVVYDCFTVAWAGLGVELKPFCYFAEV